MGPPPFGERNLLDLLTPFIGEALLQWGRRLSASGISFLRPASVTFLSGFNGAAAFRRAESPELPELAEMTPDASMGPPPFGERNVARRVYPAHGHGGFNGAAAFRRAESV